jgi:hypothetical protein
MRRASLLPFVVFAAAHVGCNKPLDEDKCQKLVDKMVDLAALEEPASDHVEKVKAQVKTDKRTLQNVKDTCIGKMTQSQYDCVMSAKKFQDATQCDQK